MTRDATPDTGAELLGLEQAHSMVRIIESAADVRRRYQFFVWIHSYLQALVPHQIAVCGCYQRARREVSFETFHSVSVDPSVLQSLSDASGLLMQQVVGHWINGAGRAVALDMHVLAGAGAGAERDRLVKAGFEQLLVDGVSRPQRPSEIETFFIFGSVGLRYNQRHQSYLDLLMPHLHSTWLRVQATEREFSQRHGGQVLMASGPTTHARAPITQREKQILGWVREGMSNQAIGEQLGISALTVKNHVQKILRKLGAANRAQAVAKAMTMNLLARDSAADTLAPAHAGN